MSVRTKDQTGLKDEMSGLARIFATAVGGLQWGCAGAWACGGCGPGGYAV